MNESLIKPGHFGKEINNIKLNKVLIDENDDNTRNELLNLRFIRAKNEFI